MKLRAVGTLACLLLASLPVSAGPYSDDLGRCLVASTTQSDRVALARWIFLAFSAHPSVAPLSAAKPDDIDRANAQIGSMFMKLMTESCLDKTRDAFTYEGPGAIQLGFQVLGQVAGMELASSPEVQARMSDFARAINEKELEAVITKPNTKAAN